MSWMNPFSWLRRSASPAVTDPFWYAPVSRAGSGGVHVDESTALTYSAVWACTRALSISAILPLEVFVGESDGVRREIVRHRVAKLWNKRPNARMTAFSFRSLMLRWQINSGNAFADISGDGMWPIHPSRVTLVDADGQIHDPYDGGRLDSFRYRVENDDRTHFLFEPEELLHIPSIVSDDGINGKGVVRHARETVGFGLSTEQYGATWFDTGGIPRMMIEQTGAVIKDEHRQAFRQEWQQIYGGPRGDKVGILPPNTKPHQISISAEDSQFLETRQHNVEEIARWYGVPPHMIGHLLNSTLNNIEHLGLEFVRYALRPWQAAIEQEIERKQLTEREQRDHFLEHDATELIRGDSVSFANYLVQLKDSGILGQNECRRELRYPPADLVDDDFTMRGATPTGDESTSDEEPAEDPAEPEENATAVAWLTSELRRTQRRDGNAAKKAAKSPERFLAWLEDWCAPETVAADVREVTGVDAALVGLQWTEQTRADLLQVAGSATACELPGKVAHVVDKAWANRVDTFVKEHCDAIFGNRTHDTTTAA